jgi:hypothetical protein
MFNVFVFNLLIFSRKKAQSVEYGFFICISEKINTVFSDKRFDSLDA